MPETALGNAIDFLTAFGFFDVVLPFLLVFTVTFGVLEKSNLFGKDKKNLNAMVAFTVGFLVVAATQITTAIQLSVPKVAFMLIILISLLLLVGSLMKPAPEGLDFWGQLSNFVKWPVGVIIAVSILTIFLSSVGWLEPIISFFRTNIGSPVITTLFFIGVLIGVVYWMMQ